ncbi:hypothetical protein AURDEDRAFT_75708 [Auricularia subglabra TFB-10046 SS5]|nr:hypothetical protein AURDEDRAFT_75708 [Auricularia subglabra TFB-10046 SS5]
MTSSDWMWEMQGQIRVGGTVIPILLSTDKTQLTAFSGEHTAYPVYMSIGNIAKHVRQQPSLRAFRLIGYLPTLKPDETTMSQDQARIIRNRLFHKAMEIILRPLFAAAKDGVRLPDSEGTVLWRTLVDKTPPEPRRFPFSTPALISAFSR